MEERSGEEKQGVRCAECGGALAHDQRYCTECGTRRAQLPQYVAGLIGDGFCVEVEAMAVTAG